jgi:hypothetical protein
MRDLNRFQIQIRIANIFDFGKFGDALQGTAADLVMRYGPLRKMKPYSEDV